MSRGGDNLSSAENFALAGISVVVSLTAPAPIERVKLMLQSQNEMLKSGRLDKPYRGIIDCSRRILTQEGVMSFWRGNLANCLRYIPIQASNFALKDMIASAFKHSKQDGYGTKISKNLAAGGLSGGMSLFFVYPLDYARTRLANDVKVACGSERQFNGLVDTFKKTLASDGVVGLYRGFFVSCVGIVVYRGCYFGFYDSFKPVVLGKNAGFMASLALGYGVTVSAGLCAYPFDTVRRRMMMTSCEASKYKGSIDCAVQIMRNEGVTSFFKGAGANILLGMVGAGLLVGNDVFRMIYVGMRG